MADRIALERLVPVAASLLIHTGLVGAVMLSPGWGAGHVPVLMAELVAADAPQPVAEPPRPPKPLVRDRRPLTPPRPIASPLPDSPPPARPESEPPTPEPLPTASDSPKPVASEPPNPVALEPKPVVPEPSAPVASEPEPGQVLASASVRAPAFPPPTGPSALVGGTSISVAADPGPGEPVPPALAPAGPAARGPAVATIPGSGATQHAIPRGGYQYRPAAVLWRKVFPSDVRDMVLSRSADGGRTFETAVAVRADRWKITACPHRGGQVAADARGRHDAVWYTEGAGGRPDVLLAVAPGGRRVGAPRRVHTATGSVPEHARLAVDASGRGIVVWEDSTAVRRRILLRSVGEGGRTLGPARTLSQAIKARAPDGAVGPGGLLIAWHEEQFPATKTVVLHVPGEEAGR